MKYRCSTCHNGCDCREEAIAELIKAKDAEIEKLKRQLCEYADGAEMLPDPRTEELRE